MLGHLGFSYTGCIFLLLLFIPNLLWTKHKPNGYNPQNENKVLVFFERVGQALVTCTALIFEDFNIHAWSIWSMWLVAAGICMMLYECWWLQYFKSEKNLVDFYRSFFGIPVAGATLPVVSFLMLGIYGKVIWLMLAAVILGIGHIGLHMEHSLEVRKNSDFQGYENK